MIYYWKYKTPVGFDDMLMNSDGEYLTGLWFVGSKDVLKHSTDGEEKFLPVFLKTCQWLDIYFSGKEPSFIPKYKINRITPFRKEVINVMNSIAFGEVVTYGDIACKIAKSRNLRRMSSQAVGGAVGWNPICIIIPCHRVVGANGNLTGYGGGMHNKIALLRHEGIIVDKNMVKEKTK